jgi:SAM-dependent MidA family methyltransferase
VNVPTPLERLLRERIARDGPLSFREVMQAALYHPEYGYYTNLQGFGATGDFITSPERHPAFGWLLGRQALDVWEALGRPRPFKILELGAGSGALAEPLLAFLRSPPSPALRAASPPNGGEAEPATMPPSGNGDPLAPHGERGAYAADTPEIVYTIDEPSPSLRAVQQRRLVDPAFRWAGADEPAHFIIANEVADALPVHRVVVRQGRLRELHVGLADDGQALIWVESPTARPELEAYFDALHYRPPEGNVADVCLDLADWVKHLSRRLPERGAALVMDYAASPPRDSLLTYYRHTMGSDPLIRLGQQDISVHVDLRTLVRLAIGEGLRAGSTAQRGLLLNLGFAQVQAKLRGPTDRQALAHLTDPNGLGGQIAAVFLLRGLPGYVPIGAAGGRDWPEPTNVPSLPPVQNESDFLAQWHEAFPGSS